MFYHYLITRFNLKNPDWELTKNNELLLDDTWMDERLHLFETYCLPSVVNQTNQNFEWLLFFDSSTSEKYITKIRTITEGYKNIRLFFINGMPNFTSSIAEFIAANANDREFLITSRIDNDDCVHKDYINEIQRVFNKQEFLAIDIINGYTLQVEPTFILGKKEHIFNPFISLIERNQNPKTVWHYVHNMWKKEPRIIHLKEKRLWLSVIHGKNKVNEFDGYGNIKWSDINSDFIIEKSMDEKIAKTQLPFGKWWFLSLRNYLYVKMVLLSKILKKSIGLYKVK
nr:glycosyltransferase [uncultured Flavobacterium sp.]